MDFLPADKHRTFLQIDSITLSMHGQGCPKYPKQQLYNIFGIFPKFRKEQVYNVCIISIKKIEMKLVFYMQIIIEVANKLITTLQAQKVVLGLLISMMKHSQITQSNNFANLCNISKMLGMEFNIWMQINANVCKSQHYHF